LVAAILYNCIETLRVASLLLHAAMPEKTAQLWRYWNLKILKDPNDPRSGFVAPLAELAAFGGAHGFKAGHAIVKGDPLFMRADGKLPAPTAAARE
jgi:methionyl-tRNA synthetase